MLARQWEKENPSALLYRQTGTASMENSMELYPKNPKTPIQKNLCTPMFTVAQFTIAKCWKQPKCPSVNEWIKKTVVHLHNRILGSREKEGAYTFCNSMDETGEHYAK